MTRLLVVGLLLTDLQATHQMLTATFGGERGCDAVVPPSLGRGGYCVSLYHGGGGGAAYGVDVKNCKRPLGLGGPLDPTADVGFFVREATLGDFTCQLSNGWRSPVLPEPGLEGLVLRDAQWDGTLGELADERFKAVDGTWLRFRLDVKSGTIALVRAEN